MEQTTQQVPERKRTSERYTDALRDLRTLLIGSSRGRMINPPAWCAKRKISVAFFRACIVGGWIERIGTRGKYRFRLIDETREITDDAGEWIRIWINGTINGGRVPKTEQRGNPNGRNRKKKEARKSPENTPQVAPNIPIPPEQRETGPEHANGWPFPFPPMPKKVIERDRLIESVRASFFNQLCPQCAETMKTIIDILTAKNTNHV